ANPPNYSAEYSFSHINRSTNWNENSTTGLVVVTVPMEQALRQGLMVGRELLGRPPQIRTELPLPIGKEAGPADFSQPLAVVVENGFAQTLAGAARGRPGGARQPQQVGRHVGYGRNRHQRRDGKNGTALLPRRFPQILPDPLDALERGDILRRNLMQV